MRVYKPLTPSLRQLCLVDHSIFSRSKDLYSFIRKKKTFSGRNHHGRITVRHRGSIVKRQYIDLAMHNRNFNIPFSIKKIEYDAYRSGFVSLIRFYNGIYSYKILVYKTFIGDTLMCYSNIPENLKNGDGCLIKYVSAGSILCDIELVPNKGSQLSRSAGCSSLLLKKDDVYAYLKISSNKLIEVSIHCMAFLGSISNKNHRYVNLGKAGRSRYLGVRPSVRGVAMNPVDHPHGGGEGKKSKKTSPRSPWGMIMSNHKKKILIK